jgi:hypothetical protein
MPPTDPDKKKTTLKPAALDHVAERERLFAKLEADLKRPPVEDDEALTDDQLLAVVKDYLDELWRNADSELDRAAYAVDLVQFANGPRPQIQLVRRPDGSVLFKLTAEPDD